MLVYASIIYMKTAKLVRLEKIYKHVLILPIYAVSLCILNISNLFLKLPYQIYFSIFVFISLAAIAFERVVSFLILREKHKMEVWKILSK